MFVDPVNHDMRIQGKDDDVRLIEKLLWIQRSRVDHVMSECVIDRFLTAGDTEHPIAADSFIDSR